MAHAMSRRALHGGGSRRSGGGWYEEHRAGLSGRALAAAWIAHWYEPPRFFWTNCAAETESWLQVLPAHQVRTDEAKLMADVEGLSDDVHDLMAMLHRTSTVVDDSLAQLKKSRLEIDRAKAEIEAIKRSLAA